MIAILLHYFHLSTSLWGLSHTFSIYDFVINDNAPNLKYNNLIAYGGSGVYVLVRFKNFVFLNSLLNYIPFPEHTLHTHIHTVFIHHIKCQL